MGNKPVRLGLRLDEKVQEAGSLMTGRVYLSVSGQQPVRADSVQLALIGEELATIAHEESDSNGHHGRDHRSSHVEIERASSSVVHMDVPLANYQNGTVAPGQYEYPFEWELPVNLPATMHCANGESKCEIQYKLCAYLNQSSSPSGSFAGSSPKHCDTKVLCVMSHSPHLQPRSDLSMEPEEFRISSCCMHQGSIWLGFDVDNTITSPGSPVQVGILGMNQSKVDVLTLRARLTETVTWTAHGRTKELTRTLTEAKLPASRRMDWQAHDRRRVSYAAIEDQHGRAMANLLLPIDARETYKGRLIDTRHCLTVTAITPGACCVTSPESSVLVKVKRKPQQQQSAAAQPFPSAPPADYVHNDADMTDEPTMVTADLLPDNWSPQEAPVVTLPLSSAVVLDSSYTAPTVSAPDESLLKESRDMANSLVSLEMALSQGYNPMDTLNRQLQSPVVVTTVQNLTPPEFVQLLKACNGRQVPLVARMLAGTMGEQFQCRHVVACLWALPPSVRIEVMRQVAPLVADLDAQRGLVEQELTPEELLHFRAALQ